MTPGTRVVWNAARWQPSDFDQWGRGYGVGEVVQSPFADNPPGCVDVRWPCGRCFEPTDALLPALAHHAAQREMPPQFAADAITRGAVIAYPTEGIWGLGCDPRNEGAVRRLLAIKQRDVAKGLIVIAGEERQLAPLIYMDGLSEAQRGQVRASWPGANTWVVPASAAAPRWITGGHDGIAVRVSAQPEVIALCAAFGNALVSTSANRAGASAPWRREELDAALLGEIDGVLTGETGGREAPSVIRDARSGAVLRG